MSSTSISVSRISSTLPIKLVNADRWTPDENRCKGNYLHIQHIQQTRDSQHTAAILWVDSLRPISENRLGVPGVTAAGRLEMFVEVLEGKTMEFLPVILILLRCVNLPRYELL